MPKEAADELLRDGLKLLDIPFTEEHISAFSVYLHELKKWNRAYNLTGIQSDTDIVIKHFLDSLLFLKVLPFSVGSVADIGSGAGFPGIPIKIMRAELQMILIEPVRKKALFLEHVNALLGIAGIEIRNQRVEDVHDLHVDAAVTRALFSVREFRLKAERFLKSKGVLILSKGPKVEEEMQGMERVPVRREELVLPFQESIRHLLVIQRPS